MFTQYENWRTKALLRFHALGYKICLDQSMAMTLDKRKNGLRHLDVHSIDCVRWAGIIPDSEVAMNGFMSPCVSGLGAESNVGTGVLRVG